MKLRIPNPSRLSQRALGPYAPQQELELNLGDARKSTLDAFGLRDLPCALMTLDQVERALGYHAIHIPRGTPDVVPAAEMTFVDRKCRRIDSSVVFERMANFLESSSEMARVYGRFDGDRRPRGPALNPVEAAIAYKRNVDALRPEASLAALETDLVKFSVLGFQIGTERDEATMVKLDQQLAKLTAGLAKNRKLRDSTAVFELGVRGLPEGVPYLVVGGVREALEYLYNDLEFNEEVIQFLKHEIPATAGWTQEQWNYLRDFKTEIKKLKISGLPDGSIYVGGPLLKIEGPAPVVEFIETALMARVSAMSAKATAQALILEVFHGVFGELGSRRPPSADSGTKDIEAVNLVADIPTSSVIAQYLKNIRAIGTMEHSAILLNGEDDETLFFVQWFLMYGQFTSALVDSRDPKAGVLAVIRAQRIIDALRPTLEQDPAYAHIRSWTIPSIRLDSGDLREQAKAFRGMLDDAGMTDTKIMVMDGMHADKLKSILYDDDGTEIRIDAAGAGESLRFPIALNDLGQPYHWLGNLVYKAAQLHEGDLTIDMMKLSASPSKATRPSRRLSRVFDADGKMVRDVAGLASAVVDVPEAPRGGRVQNRLELLASRGKPDASFLLPIGEYWEKVTRRRFLEESRSLPTTWRERDQARSEGRPWRPVFDESAALTESVLRFAERAGRRSEFEAYFAKSKG